jgi:hypothetical protein
MAIVMAMAMAMAEVKQIQVTPQVYINPCISHRKWKLFHSNKKGTTSHCQVPEYTTIYVFEFL